VRMLHPQSPPLRQNSFGLIPATHPPAAFQNEGQAVAVAQGAPASFAGGPEASPDVIARVRSARYELHLSHCHAKKSP